MVYSYNEILYSYSLCEYTSNKLVNNKYLREKPQNILSEKGKIQKYKQYDTNFIMETHTHF